MKIFILIISLIIVGIVVYLVLSNKDDTKMQDTQQPMPLSYSFNLSTNSAAFNVGITLGDGTPILSGILKARSVSSIYNNVFQVTSIEINNNTYTANNTVPPTITYPYTNLVTSPLQPFLVCYYAQSSITTYGSNYSLGVVNRVIESVSDMTQLMNILSTANSGVFYTLSNQLLYVGSKGVITTIPTAVDLGNGNSISLGLDGNYYNTINSQALTSQGSINNVSPVNADYDMTSGIFISNYGIDSNKNIVYNPLNSFNFWYSPRHNAWNFISYVSYIGPNGSEDIRYYITGAGPTVNEIITNITTAIGIPTILSLGQSVNVNIQ